MKLLKETRKYYLFSIDGFRHEIINGIKLEGDMAWFPRSYPEGQKTDYINTENSDKETFRTVEDCEQWYSDHVKGDVMTHKKEFVIQNKGIDPTDQDWELMKKWMSNPQNFTKDDFRIYEDWTAHNIVDRDGERFSPGYLEALNKTIIGKLKMIQNPHDWRMRGEGKYFKSRIETMDVSHAVDIIGPHPDPNYKKMMDRVAQIDGGIKWSVATFYIGKRKKELIPDLDDGTAGPSSVGFRGPSAVEVKDDDGNILWMEYQLAEGEGAETVECSTPGVESQYGAGVKKGFNIVISEVTKPLPNEHTSLLEDPAQFESFQRKNCAEKHDEKYIDIIYGIKGDRSIIQSLRYNKDTWTDSEAKAHCEERGGKFEAAEESKIAAKVIQQEVIGMKFKLESISFEKDIELDEDSMKGFQDELEDKMQPIVEDAIEARAEIKSLKEVFGEDLDVEKANELKTLSLSGAKYEKSLIEDIVKYMVTLKQVAFDEVKVQEQRDILLKLSLEQLESQRDNLSAQVDKITKHPGVLPENSEDLTSTKKEREVNSVPDSRFSTD